MKRIAPISFFSRPTGTVAKDLLGARLMRRYRGKVFSGMITEVEVYDGFRDKASHASRGQTPRNAPMFGSAGRWYVYLTYGMHWMLNIVTREKGYPAAILIRAVRPVRGRKGSRRVSTSNGIEGLYGPGRLTKAFHINKQLNGLPAMKKSGLWIFLPQFSMRKRRKIKKLPRVGVDYAGPYWAKRRLRFSME